MSNFSRVRADIDEMMASRVYDSTIHTRAAIIKRLYDAIANGDSYIILPRNVAPDLLADIWASFDTSVHTLGYKVMLPQGPAVPPTTQKSKL